jgi:hypothetical protein
MFYTDKKINTSSILKYNMLYKVLVKLCMGVMQMVHITLTYLERDFMYHILTLIVGKYVIGTFRELIHIEYLMI